MKNIERIKSLIEQLKQEIENEYELKRINLIEKDLIQGLPEVKIIDDRTQKFNGRIYTLNQGGHFGSIHRDVWIYYNATVPSNEYDVHHVDLINQIMIYLTYNCLREVSTARFITRSIADAHNLLKKNSYAMFGGKSM